MIEMIQYMKDYIIWEKNINGNKPRNFKFGSLDSKPGLLSNNKRLKKNKVTKKAYDDYVIIKPFYI